MRKKRTLLPHAMWAILAGMGLLLVGPAFAEPIGLPNVAIPHAEFTFHHDNILGTSLDLVVVAPVERTAQACEQVVLDEIERLRRVLSTYDPESELSRINRTSGPCRASRELIDVLRAYDHWNERSRRAFNGQLGNLVRVWKEAEVKGTLPSAGILGPLVRQINRPAWRIDSERGTVERLTTQPLNLNSIGKGYILGKATAAARLKTPTVAGMLVNLGGDVLALGESVSGHAWRVGIADPRHPEENSPPLAEVQLQDRAIATSAAYERYFTIGGRRYSHIFDPRTGWPAAGVTSATVIAADNVTANALATTLCVLPPNEGLALVESTPGASCLLVLPNAKQLRSRDFARAEIRQDFIVLADKESKFPKDFQVSITLELLRPEGGKIRRPYAAIWVEDADKKPVRMLTVWGDLPQYQRDLTKFWKIARDQRDRVEAMTRATRPPGKYTIAWNGLDDKGEPVERGIYTIVVEVHREHGKHVKQVGKIACEEGRSSVTLERTAETAETKVEYGPPGT